MTALERDELVAMVQAERPEIEADIVYRAASQLLTRNQIVDKAAEDELAADVHAGIDAMLQWLTITQIDRKNAFFRQLVEHSLQRGSLAQETVGGFELANTVVLEHARRRFGPGKLLSDSERRLQSGAAIARMVVASIMLERS